MPTLHTHTDPTSEAVVKLWEETWGELVPGTESGVRLYLSELVGMACPALEAQSWPIKAQGAAAIATIAEKMGEGSPDISVSAWELVCSSL